MEDDNQAWYKAATKVFKPGTPEGDMIRSGVPTTPKSSTPQFGNEGKRLRGLKPCDRYTTINHE